MHSGVDLKLVQVGRLNKTFLFRCFVHGSFEMSDAMGNYFAVKSIKIDEKYFSVSIWDTGAHHDRLTTATLMSAEAVIIFVSLFTILDRNKATLEVKEYLDMISISANKNAAIILAFTETRHPESKEEYDVDQKTIKENCIWIAKKYNLPYYICNPFTNEGVIEVFHGVVEKFLSNHKKEYKNNNPSLFSSPTPIIKEKISHPETFPPTPIIKEKIPHSKWTSVKERLEKITEKLTKEEPPSEQNNQTQLFSLSLNK